MILGDPLSTPCTICERPERLSSFSSSTESRVTRFVEAWMLQSNFTPVRTIPSAISSARSRSTRKLSSTTQRRLRLYRVTRSVVSSTTCSGGSAFHLRPYTPALVQYEQLYGQARLVKYIHQRS